MRTCSQLGKLSLGGARFAARWFVISLVVTMLVASSARAEDRDSAVVGKITFLNRKAVDAYQHLEFETAMRLLNEALDLSERSGLTMHPIRARTFVTMGIVTLGGMKQRDQAVKYFRKALQIQPEVRLSSGLANPEIQAAFDEAIATLSSGSSDELTPEKALVHTPVQVAQGGQAVPITVMPDKDLGASAIVLRYRAGNAATFTDVPMQKNGMGAYEGAIPASATSGDQVVYFIEARRSDGSVIVKRGTAADPIVVNVVAAAPVAAAPTTPTSPAPAPDMAGRFYISILGGTGVGYARGTGEVTRNAVTSPGLVWTRAAQLAPEVGYFVTSRLSLGVQARLQLVSGATDYHVPMPVGDECGSDHVCSPFKGAFAALLKASWRLADPSSDVQPYVAFSAGGGYIRHVTDVTAPPTCGSTGTQACKDTVAGGAVLFGPAVGLQYKLADFAALVAELNALVGAPNFTVNADLNIGVAFQL